MKKLVVCIASYNGVEYIGEQLASILCQIGVNDVVVVSDDNSSDGTAEVVLGIDDPRIHLVKNSTISNSNYVSNFENALKYAVEIGPFDYVFLSDQDDVWLPNKVASICQFFEGDDKYIFVCHSLKYVDDRLKPLPINNYEDHRYDAGFLVRSLLRPFGAGCGMAFRFELLKRILPFPKKYCYSHDHWIPLVAYLSGRCYYLNTPLLLYRRHGRSLTEIFVSPSRKGFFGRFFERIYLRISYFLMILTAVIRCYKFVIDNPEYMVSKRVGGFRPIVIVDSLLISARHDGIYSSDLDLNHYRLVCRLPIRALYFRPLTRLFRAEISAAVKLNSTEILVHTRSHIYLANVMSGLFALDFSIPEGRKLLKFSIDCTRESTNSDVYFGEYFSNEEKSSVRIWRRSSIGVWCIAYTFPDGVINHVHAIYVYDDFILGLTGDFGMASAQWVFSRDFLTVRLLCGGQQSYRSCSVLRVDSKLYYPTDTHIEVNNFVQVDLNSEESQLRVLTNINGSSIYSMPSLGGIYFSTAVEPAEEGCSSIGRMFSVFKSRFIHDYFSYIYRFSISDNSVKPIFRARKDWLPFRLFQFGTFSFPCGVAGEDWVIAYGIGLSGFDGASILLKKTS